ncbi:MAG: SCO family protein [Bacteroidota bacterium]
MSRTALGRLVIILVFILPLGLVAFMYSASEPVRTSVPYEYDLVENGDTLFHALPVFALEDLDGQAFTDQDLKGNVSVINFFTTQNDPQLLTKVLHGNLKRTFSNINWEREPNLLFVAINMGDTLPEVQTYWQNQQQDLHEQGWKILTGAQEEIYKLATQGLTIPDFVRHQPGDAPFTAQTVALVDKSGRVRKYYKVTDLAEERKLQEDIIALWRMEYPEELEG